MDPQFWADFLVGPAWFGTGKLWIGPGEPGICYKDDSLLEQLWPLPAASGNQDHTCTRFVVHRVSVPDQYRHLSDDKSITEAYPLVDDAREGPLNGAQSISARHNLVIWQNQHARDAGQDRNNQTTPWIGVVALQNQDSKIPVDNQKQWWYVFRDYISRPAMRENIDMKLRFTQFWEGRPQRTLKANYSIGEIFRHHLDHHFKERTHPPFLSLVQQAPNLMLMDIFRLVGCFWITELESKHLRLSWIEQYYYAQVKKRRERFSLFNLLIPNPGGVLSEKIQTDLTNLHGHRIEIGSYHYLLTETAKHCKTYEGAIWKEIVPEYKRLSDDFGYLQEATNRLESRVDKTTSYLHSISEDLEKERSGYRNMLLFILAVWAFLVSPISLSASIVNLERGQTATKVGSVQVFWKVAVSVGASVILLIISMLLLAEIFYWRARRRVG
ncbi:hypothetical protein N7530_009145 [Penicillium desertorum]|uniref:Uncharacterized protein n=1 Tax=Penicillium desertorum TaxID=1303715 RepID=A0A9X0BLV0_9EURO|nr:hypothetical protein N7530_009145 [Penicillium desertorum]